ncbi:MAG: NeuD/PglB/VioB family sugar acetyltransferase [candidate division WOR-3 bacterium]
MRLSDKQIAVYGAGGFGRGIAWLAQVCGNEVVCFIDDDELKIGKIFNEIPVLTLEEARKKYPHTRVVVAVNEPKARESIVSKVINSGFTFATLVHPHVELSPWVKIGEGSIIREGCNFSVNIVLGRHVILNMDCTIGHDAVLDDYVTLAPGAHISGYNHLGKRVNIGTGAVVINGTQEEPLVIGDDAIVGAGACVIRPVPPGVTVVGVPARPIEKRLR